VSAACRNGLATLAPRARAIGQNVRVAHRGKRVGPKRRTSFRPTALLLAIGITLGVGAWGYLVKAAIDFGIQARNGTPGAWTYLALACVGAVACLFIGLMLVARLLRALGITSGPESRPREPEPPRPVGGRRAR
jgi:hypothetical protein